MIEPDDLHIHIRQSQQPLEQWLSVSIEFEKPVSEDLSQRYGTNIRLYKESSVQEVCHAIEMLIIGANETWKSLDD